MTKEDGMGEAAGELIEVAAGHVPELLRHARRFARSEADAEDAVQEVLLAVVRAPHVLGAVERLGSWLVTLVRRRCADIVREDRRRAELERRAMDGCAGGEGPSGGDEADELCRDVARAVRELPEDLRAPLVGNVLGGKTFRELSSETGVPMGTLMARKARAVELVREKLRRRGLVG
jgi:RNA polymerase sigma factor (sigma-70 family)